MLPFSVCPVLSSLSTWGKNSRKQILISLSYFHFEKSLCEDKWHVHCLYTWSINQCHPTLSSNLEAYFGWLPLAGCCCCQFLLCLYTKMVHKKCPPLSLGVSLRRVKIFSNDIGSNSLSSKSVSMQRYRACGMATFVGHTFTKRERE